MPTISLSKLGFGADTTRNPSALEPGWARQSVNMLHNRPGDDRAELRSGVVRLQQSRPSANSVLGLYEFVDNAGSITPFEKIGTALRKFSVSDVTNAGTQMRTGLASAIQPHFTTFMNFMIMADSAKTYIGNGTTVYPFSTGVPATITATLVAAGVLTGTYYYDYAYYSSITGEIGVPKGAALAVTAATQQVDLNVYPTIDTTEQFDSIIVFRTKVGTTGPYYRVGTSTFALLSIGTGKYRDNNSDASLTTLSTVHTNPGGAVLTSQPEAAVDCVQFKGRIFIALTASSRMRWSQLLACQFDSTTDARHDVEPDDGDYLRRMLVYNGVLMLFKDHSIHYMGGDVDQSSFVWQPASPREMGIGAYAPHTAVSTPAGVCFGAQSGVYVFRPSMSAPEKISFEIDKTYQLADMTKRTSFIGGYNPITRAYLIGWYSTGSTVLDQVWAWYVDTRRWTKIEVAVNKINPASFGLFHNSSSVLKCMLGDSTGFVHEMDVGGTDGLISGTVTGTVTSGGTGTLNDTGAAFATAGNGLLGASVSIQVSGATVDTEQVTANTGTQLTTTTTTSPYRPPAAGEKYYVGAIRGLLSLGRLDAGTGKDKFWKSVVFEFQKQTHTVPIVVGYTVDDDAQPTYAEAILGNAGSRISLPVERVGVGLSPYVSIIGANAPLELIRIEVEYEQFMTEWAKS